MNEIYGLITAFKRFAVHDGDGIRTTVFLKGCPLSCLWCHNPECISPKAELSYYANKCGLCGECAAACPNGAHLLSAEKHIFLRDKCIACGSCVESCRFNALQLEGKRLSVDEVMKTVLEDIDFYKTSGGGLTVSGGEPTMQSEFTLALLKAAKSSGINTALDTCGYSSRRIFEEMLPYVDTFLYDIKHISPIEHTRLTGRSNERIIENLRFLSASGARIEIRIPIIPGCNDDEPTLRGMAKLLSEVNFAKVKLLPYHSYAGSKYKATNAGVKKSTSPLSSKGILPPSGKGLWHNRSVQSILTNEKYKGDAILNKTYTTDCISKKIKVNNGERPKYYVENNHPAIIDSATFGRVQEELARRSGKRKVKQIGTKTEQGKYCGKYALTELLICGECGTPTDDALGRLTLRKRLSGDASIVSTTERNTATTRLP